MLGEVAAMRPEHLLAIERLFISDQPYGEPRDNACSDSYLPLQIQRLQLAQYGMDNFKPKSTDWLRVTLFQGAPRLGDLMHLEALRRRLGATLPLPGTPPEGGTHVIIDGLEINKWSREVIEEVRSGGVDIVHATVGVWEDTAGTFERIGAMRHLVRQKQRHRSNRDERRRNGWRHARRSARPPLRLPEFVDGG